MNEIRDLIIGIDIGKEYTQICYYDTTNSRSPLLHLSPAEAESNPVPATAML